MAGKDTVIVRGKAEPVVGEVVRESWQSVVVKTDAGERTLPGWQVATVSRFDTPEDLDAALALGDFGRYARALAVLEKLGAEASPEGSEPEASPEGSEPEASPEGSEPSATAKLPGWTREHVAFHRANFLRIRREIAGEGVEELVDALEAFLDAFPDSRLAPAATVMISRIPPLPGRPSKLGTYFEKLGEMGGAWPFLGRIARALAASERGAHDKALRDIAAVEQEAKKDPSWAAELAVRVEIARAEVALHAGDPRRAVALLAPLVGFEQFEPFPAAAEALVLLARAARDALGSPHGDRIAFPLYFRVVRYFPDQPVALAEALAAGAKAAEACGEKGIAESFRSMRARRFPFTA